MADGEFEKKKAKFIEKLHAVEVRMSKYKNILSDETYSASLNLNLTQFIRVKEMMNDFTRNIFQHYVKRSNQDLEDNWKILVTSRIQIESSTNNSFIEVINTQGATKEISIKDLVEMQQRDEDAKMVNNAWQAIKNELIGNPSYLTKFNVAESTSQTSPNNGNAQTGVAFYKPGDETIGVPNHIDKLGINPSVFTNEKDFNIFVNHVKDFFMKNHPNGILNKHDLKKKWKIYLGDQSAVQEVIKQINSGVSIVFEEKKKKFLERLDELQNQLSSCGKYLMQYQDINDVAGLLDEFRGDIFRGYGPQCITLDKHTAVGGWSVSDDSMIKYNSETKKIEIMITRPRVILEFDMKKDETTSETLGGLTSLQKEISKDVLLLDNVVKNIPNKINEMIFDMFRKSSPLFADDVSTNAEGVKYLESLGIKRSDFPTQKHYDDFILDTQKFLMRNCPFMIADTRDLQGKWCDYKKQKPTIAQQQPSVTAMTQS